MNRVILKLSGIVNSLLAIEIPSVATADLTRVLLDMVLHNRNRTLKSLAVGLEDRCSLFRQAKVGASVRVSMSLAVLVSVSVSRVVSGWWTGSSGPGTTGAFRWTVCGGWEAVGCRTLVVLRGDL